MNAEREDIFMMMLNLNVNENRMVLFSLKGYNGLGQVGFVTVYMVSCPNQKGQSVGFILHIILRTIICFL